MRGVSKYERTREIIKMDLVKQEDYTQNVLLCVPRFAWDVCRSFLVSYGKRRSSYAMAYFAGYYQTPDDVEFDQIEASIDEFLGGMDMSCDLSEKLECICNAIQEVAAATYAGNVGSNYLPANDQQPSEFEDTGDNYPDGFASAAEYAAYKCDMAHTIFDDIRADMVTLSTVDLVALTGALALAPLLVTGVPGVLLIAGYVILTSSLIVGTAFFLEAVDALDDRENDIICALYNAATVQEAKNGFADELYQYAGWSSSLVPGTLGSLMDIFLNWTNLNDLFSRNVGRESGQGNDCSGCEPVVCPQFYTSNGVLQAEAEGQATWLSTLSSGCYRINVHFNNTSSSTATYCGPTVTIASVVPSQTPVSCGGNLYRCFDQAHTQIYASTVPPTNLSGVAWVAIQATQPIQYQITWIDD